MSFQLTRHGIPDTWIKDGLVYAPAATGEPSILDCGRVLLEAVRARQQPRRV